MQKELLTSTAYDGLKNATHIDVEVYYTKGGVSYFSGDTTPRGYYLSATPATHKDGTVSYTLFSGVKKLLMPANRFSAKQFEQAVELGKQEASALIDVLLKSERAA